MKYEADHEKGFVADVSYYGEAKYPPPSSEPPFVIKVIGPKLMEDISVPSHEGSESIKPMTIKELSMHLLSKSMGKEENEKESMQSSEVSADIPEETSKEVPHQEHQIRPKPVFAVPIHHIPLSSENENSESEKNPQILLNFKEDPTHFDEFDAHISYQAPRIHFLQRQKPTVLGKDISTLYHVPSPLGNQILEKHKNDNKEEEDFLTEITKQIAPFNSRIGGYYRAIPLPLLNRNRFPLGTLNSYLYTPRYASTVVAKPSQIPSLIEAAPFNYGTSIGHSLYPLRLRGSYSKPRFFQSSPLLIRLQKPHSGDDESIHSDERGETPIHGSNVGHFQFLTRNPHRRISHLPSPAFLPPVYASTDSEKSISGEEPPHNSQHQYFGMEDEEENSPFKENSSVSRESMGDKGKSQVPSKL